MRALPGTVLLGWIAVATPVAGQIAPDRGGPWQIGITVGTSTFNGAAAGTDESGADLVFRPHRPTMLGLGLSYGRDRVRWSLSARYGQPGLGFKGVEDATSSAVLIVAENAFHLATFTTEVGTRLLRLRGGPVVRSSLGLTVERWTAPGTPGRTRIGPQGGLALEFALTSGLFASIEGELGFTPGSPFLEGDLPEGFRLRSTWRRTIGAGVGIRL